MKVIDAGQEVGVGQLWTSEDDAVAAVCCCRRQGRFLDGRSFGRLNYLRFHVGEGLPLTREQSYHTLSRQDAARWSDLGTYRA